MSPLGILKSRSRTSGLVRSTNFVTSSPLEASPTTRMSFSSDSILFIPSRHSVWSSAITTLVGIIFVLLRPIGDCAKIPQKIEAANRDLGMSTICYKTIVLDQAYHLTSFGRKNTTQGVLR